MKNTIRYIGLCLLASVALISCSDSTDAEADVIDVPGKSDKYYESLRNWKASYQKEERGVSFGWFGGWNGTGAALNTSLIGLPDSMHMVSIWSEWKVITDEMKKDLRTAQEVKGMKVMVCMFTQDVGDAFTPAGENVLDYWGWDPNESKLNEEPTENQKKAIRKYARVIVDVIDEHGYDGLDIDHEPNYGGAGDLASSRPRLYVFVEELSKYLGPLSGTGRYLAVDGEPQSMPAESGPMWDWFIVQAYDSPGVGDLNTRLKRTINNFAGVLEPAEAARKYVVAENFEKNEYNQKGGCNFRQEDGTIVKSFAGMAGWTPLIDGVRYSKGGAGVYHIEYEYTAPEKNGFYPFTSEAIRIMNAKAKKD